MVQPILNYIGNFDANNDCTFTFVYLGAEKSSINMVSIREDVKNSKPIYEQQQISLDKKHILSGGTLQNGKSYYAKVKVKIGGDTWSDWSPEISFMCLDTPNITFDIVDDKGFIYTNDVLMSVVYRQAQDDKVLKYQFTLLDQRHVTITQFPVRVPIEASPNRFTERMSGLIKGRLYYVSCKVVTAHGITYEAEQQFTPQYIVPTIDGIIHPMANPDEGQIVVEAFLKQLLGTPVKPYIPNRPTDSDDHYTYYNNEWVIIPSDNPLMFTKLGMAKASDWVAKVWCMNVQNGLMLDFSPELGDGIHLKFYKHDNYITCEKEFAGVKSRSRSNIIEGLGLKAFYLYIKVIEYRIEMKIVLKED